MIELYCFQVSFKFSLRSNEMNLGKNVKGENSTDFVQLVIFCTVLLIFVKDWYNLTEFHLNKHNLELILYSSLLYYEYCQEFLLKRYNLIE